MEQKFKVIYLGQLADDSNRTLITERFADKFKMSVTKANKILTAGKEVTLHPGAEHVKAYKLKAALEDLGLMMRLERVQMAKVQAKRTATPQAEAEPEVEPTPVVANELPKHNTADLSLEPMAEENEEQETEEQTSTKEATSASEETKDKINNPKAAANVHSPSWDLEPIDEEKATAEADEEAPAPAVEKQAYVDLSKPAMVYEKKETTEQDLDEEKPPENNADKNEHVVLGFIKQFGGVIVAGLVGVLFLAKKFGLLKFLKIGGLMAAAAYAGYSPEEACMGNGECEDAVSDQIDACWSYSEMDQYDWDNMSDEQYYELKPQVEEKFIACFRYEDNGAAVFESPIDLRFDLIDMCDTLSNPVSSCAELAESQIKGCYDRAELGPIIKAAEYDYFGSMLTNMENFKHFYGCFEDANGSMLFAEYVNDMDVDAINAALKQLKSEIDAQ